MKRIFDIFFSLIAIFFLCPLFFFIILLLKFSGEGEIFFLQNRIGYGGKNFKIFKFATMLKNSPNIGTGSITIKNDNRVLYFGNFLRKTKINELPQLFNILKGDMSFIGPRPLTIDTFKFYPEYIKKKILEVKPGLSGLGSIFFRNEENVLNVTNINSDFYLSLVRYKGELEIWFVNNNNIKNYFKLIFLTIFVVLFPKKKLLNKFFEDLPTLPINLKEHML